MALHSWKVYTSNPTQPNLLTLTTTPAAPPDYITYLRQYRHLLCKPCRSVIPLKQLPYHLINYHALRRPLARQLQQKAEKEAATLGSWISEDESDVVPLPNGSVPLPYLKPPFRGWRCREEGCSHLTASVITHRSHRNKVHCSPASLENDRASECYMQHWISYRHNYAHYWVVQHPRQQQQVERQLSLPSSSSLSAAYADLDPELAKLLAVEAEEDARLARENNFSTSIGEALEHDENTDWLRGSKWPQWFQGKSLALISAAATLPKSNGLAQDYVLGSWQDRDWVSGLQCEQRLQQLLDIVPEVTGRCEDTLRQTPRTYLCWLKSWGRNYFPMPFDTPRRKATLIRYYSYLRRFLTYIFRSWSACKGSRMDLRTWFGFQLTQQQEEAMTMLWSECQSMVETRYGVADPEPVPAHCSEALFRLLVLFWTDTTDQAGIPIESKALIHFSGVLGIHPLELAYRTAHDYTPYLSAIIWIGRLLLLEYALPLYPYSIMEPLLPSRSSYESHAKRLNDEIRSKYLLRGCMAPMAYLIERLRHGRAIAEREGTRSNISWSEDGEVLHIADCYLSMTALRQTIRDLLHQIRTHTEKMLLGLDINYSLRGLTDDLTKRKPGHSFMSVASNYMQENYKLLNRFAFSKEGGFSMRGRGRAVAFKYIKARDQLVSLLFAGVHITSGMPARGEELRVIRWADTQAASRNVFIHQGHLLLVFQYNKCSTRTNNSFYIVRVPCPQVEQALFLYLAYIRPFCDFLARRLELITAPTSNPHLFAKQEDATGCYTSAQCRQALLHATEGSPVPLTISTYRQVVVSISKKHLPALLQAFDPHTPEDHDSFLKMLAYQTGHNPKTRASVYALDMAYPAHLQPELVQKYIANSLIWHKFISSDSKGLPPIGSSTTAAAQPSSPMHVEWPHHLFVDNEGDREPPSEAAPTMAAEIQPRPKSCRRTVDRPKPVRSSPASTPPSSPNVTRLRRRKVQSRPLSSSPSPAMIRGGYSDADSGSDYVEPASPKSAELNSSDTDLSRQNRLNRRPRLCTESPILKHPACSQIQNPYVPARQQERRLARSPSVVIPSRKRRRSQDSDREVDEKINMIQRQLAGMQELLLSLREKQRRKKVRGAKKVQKTKRGEGKD